MEHAFGTIEQPEVLPIADIKQENERVRTFYFDKAMKSQPGQFVIVWIPRLDEKPFSIASEEN
ncbi:dihydroorotate dehydrogenase electron transfer subunit, partial [Patescibacteria group bacterium]|nr:dihydroorotate dehydrogenase electron transfer subunit [Patescibacteria group bacterium]